MAIEVERLVLQNTLANSSSPYVRAHKDNPVAWQEWNSNIIALAKTHQRPIFLSIGYSACHWCHVMERESFCSREVAEVLNNSFIPIKLDRESRPDLDEIYMNYVTATTGTGGWPLNVFLTPDLQPIFGGTYWPGPSSNTAVPQGTDPEEKPLNFLDIIQKVASLWATERERCIQSAAEITQQLQAFAAEGIHSHGSVQVKGGDAAETESPEPLDLDLLDDALGHYVLKYDQTYGGFNSAPKFPTPVNITFLLRIGASISFDDRPSTHTRFGFPTPVPGILGEKSCATAASMALHTLLAMSRSALRDHLGYGFHRYSVTPDWNLPHFEKMLYDNAQLLGAYCDAWALARNPEILGTIYSLVEYFTDPSSPVVFSEGGWYSSEDADSRPTPNSSEDKKEGAFYVWSEKDFQSILGDRDAAILARHFGVKPDGNVPAKNDIHDEFLTQNTLFIDVTPSVLAKEFGLKEEEIVRVIKAGKQKLTDHRNARRPRPDVDRKIIVSWNGLAIAALARAAATLSKIDHTRAQRCQEAAQKAVVFIQSKMFNSTTKKLTRVYNPDISTEGSDRDLAFIDDYAYLVQGLIGLYDLTFDQKYLDFAVTLQSTLDDNFLARTSGGYFQSIRQSPASNSSPEQILKLKPGTDSSMPAPNGIIASNLLYLASYMATTPAYQDQDNSSSRIQNFSQQAKRTMDAFAVEVIQHPFLYLSLLSAAVMDALNVRSLIVPPQMSPSEVDEKGLRGWGRTVVRGTENMRANEIMICTKDGVCRILKPGELDKSAEEVLEEEAQSIKS